MSQKIAIELQKLSQDRIVTLFVFDLSNQNGGIFHFCPSSTQDHTEIVWQGEIYIPYPMQASGFEEKSSGTLPTPKITVSNVKGLFSSLCLTYRDLLGCRIIRKRTYLKFMDGQASADPTAHFPDDIYYVEHKEQENYQTMTFALATGMNVEGVSLPRRMIIGNLCQWLYRSAECSFTEEVVITDDNENVIGATQTYKGAFIVSSAYHLHDVVFTIGLKGYRRFFICTNDNSGAGIGGKGMMPPNSAFWTEDQCGKKWTSCFEHFGANYVASFGLPIGAFPAVEYLPF